MSIKIDNDLEMAIQQASENGLNPKNIKFARNLFSGTIPEPPIFDGYRKNPNGGFEFKWVYGVAAGYFYFNGSHWYQREDPDLLNLVSEDSFHQYLKDNLHVYQVFLSNRAH